MKNNIVTDLVKQLTAMGNSLGKIPWLVICGLAVGVIIFVPLLITPDADSIANKKIPKDSVTTAKGDSTASGKKKGVMDTSSPSGVDSASSDIKMTFEGETPRLQSSVALSDGGLGSLSRPWFVIGAMLITALGVFVFREGRIEIVKPGPAPSKDPPAFIDLIKRNSDAIQLLETPRRIKRFCNRLRLHFNLLDNGLLQGDSRIGGYSDQLYFELLLLFELDRSLDKGKKTLQGFLKEDEDQFIQNVCAKDVFVAKGGKLGSPPDWEGAIGTASTLIVDKRQYFSVLRDTPAHVLHPTLKIFFTLNRDTVI